MEHRKGKKLYDKAQKDDQVERQMFSIGARRGQRAALVHAQAISYTRKRSHRRQKAIPFHPGDLPGKLVSFLLL